MKKKVERTVEITCCDACGREAIRTTKCPLCGRDLCLDNQGDATRRHLSHSLSIYDYSHAQKVEDVMICTGCADKAIHCTVREFFSLLFSK